MSSSASVDMSLPLADRFVGHDAGEVETRAAAGGMAPEGFYKATLTGAKNETSTKGTTGAKLTFCISDGPFKGIEVEDTLWNTDHAKSQDRLCLFALRLGVLARDQSGKIIKVEGKHDFMDVLDTPCVIEIRHENWKSEDGKKEGVSMRLAFGGVYYANDKEALAKVGKSKSELSKSGGTSGASGAGSGGSGGKSGSSSSSSAGSAGSSVTAGQGGSTRAKVDVSQL